MADSQNVNINLTAQDNLSPVLQRSVVSIDLVEKALQQFDRQMQATGTSQAKLSQALGNANQFLQALGSTTTAAGQTLDRFGGVINQTVVKSLSDLEAGVRAANTELQQMQHFGVGAAQDVATAGSKIGSVFGQILTIAGGLGLATSVQQLAGQMVEFGKSVITVGAQMQQLRAGLTAVTGGTQQGTEAFRFITDTANRYGFSLTSLTDNYKNLAAATRGTSLEGQQTQRVFEAVTQAARTLGSSQTQVHGALLALEQMVSKGTVSMEELRRQLGNALPGAFEIAARAMGMTTSEFGKLVKTGELLTEDFLPKFERQLRKEFGGAAVEATTTASVAFQRLENEWMALKDRIAKSGPLKFVTTIVNAAGTVLGAGRLAEEEAQLDVERLARTTSVQAAPGARPRPGSLGGATEDQIARLRALRDELRNPARQRYVGPEGISMDTARTPEAIQMDIQKLLNEVESRRRTLQGAAARGTLDEDPLTKQAEAAVEAEAANKKLKEALDAADKAEKALLESSKLAPQTFGRLTGDADEKVEFLTRRIKLLQEELEKLTKLQVNRPGSSGLVPEELRGRVAQMDQEIGRLTKQKDAIQEAQRAAETAERKAEREREAATRKAQHDAEQRQKTTDKLLADARLAAEREEALLAGVGDPAEQQRAREDAEVATLRQTIAEKGLGQAVEEQAVAYLRRQQAARASMHDAQEALKELQHDRQERLKDLDIFGLNVAPEVEKQRQFSRKIQEAIDAARAPVTDRPETKLRSQADREGIVLDADMEARLQELTAIRQAQAQERQMERMAQNLARNIQQTFDSMWESIFSGGVTSFQSFAVVLLQGIQRMFAQLTNQIMNQLLNALTNTTDEKGGWAGALAQGIVKAGISLFGSDGEAPEGSDIPGMTNDPAVINDLQSQIGALGARAAGGGVFRGLGMIRALAGGGIVDRPSFALLGEQSPMTKEAIVPMPNGAVPVQFTGQQQSSPPMIIEIHNDYSNAVSPSALKTGKKEIIQHVIDNIRNDGSLRRIIQQSAR